MDSNSQASDKAAQSSVDEEKLLRQTASALLTSPERRTRSISGT